MSSRAPHLSPHPHSSMSSSPSPHAHGGMNTPSMENSSHHRGGSTSSSSASAPPSSQHIDSRRHSDMNHMYGGTASSSTEQRPSQRPPRPASNQYQSSPSHMANAHENMAASPVHPMVSHTGGASSSSSSMHRSESPHHTQRENFLMYPKNSQNV